jgi:hypothetical protein
VLRRRDLVVEEVRVVVAEGVHVAVVDWESYDLLSQRVAHLHGGSYVRCLVSHQAPQARIALALGPMRAANTRIAAAWPLDALSDRCLPIQACV